MRVNLIADLRLALRTLRVHPRFALLAVAVYAVGIGSNTAVFTIVDDVLLDPLPFADSERIVVVWERHPERGLEEVPPAPAKLLEWRERDDLFQSVTSHRTGSMDFSGSDGPERLRVGLAYTDFLAVLGVEPLIGRDFLPADLRPGGDRVLLLSHPFWTSRMGAASDALGRTISLDGEPHEIVGVLPPGAVYPDGLDVVKPMVIDNAASRVAHGYSVLARLAPGVTIDDARRALTAMAERNAVQYADTDAGWSVEVTPLRQQMVGDLGRSLFLFQGAAAFVLLIACANVASLLLVRASSRGREMAVRASLGAGRGRLVAQVTTESLVLALLGGAIGLAVARVGAGALLALSPVDIPLTDVGFDATVYLFALLVSVASGVVFGVVPALRGTGRAVMSAIRESGSTTGRSKAAVRRGIVAGEIAAATTLFLGAALFLRSLAELSAVDPGFDSNSILVGDVRPSFYRYGSGRARADVYERLVETLGNRPGVVSAGAVSYLPMGGSGEAFRFQIQGREPATFADLEVAEIRAVSAGYFTTLGIEVVEGRALHRTDRRDTEPVVVINQAMAQRFWPEGRALDGHISISGDEGPWIRIVGVIEDIRHLGLARSPQPEMYVPVTQEPWPAMSLVARVRGDPLGYVEMLRAAVAEVDPLLPIDRIQPMEDLVERSRAPWRFQAVIVGVAAAIAALLAAVGVYGLLSYLVQERASELGLRRALGAGVDDVRRLVAKDVGRLVVAGVLVGLLTGLLLTRVVSGMLYGVDPLDPASYLGAALLLGFVAAAAAWLPARRAMKVDPTEVLRSA